MGDQSDLTPRLTLDDPSAVLAEASARTVDVVVIGGGITGAGVAREAALRGLDVVLVEADDFAAGTSSRSSKLIHGGLRYLAMGDVALVRETALERRSVRALAPHLAEPCWLVVPTSGHRSSLKFRAAIGTYEKLGAVDAADRHHNWDREELAAAEPLLRSDTFDGAVVYREYLTDDARLVLAVLRSAVGAGALVLSRCPVISVEGSGPEKPHPTVTVAHHGVETTLVAQCVVNAAGPWVEEVLRSSLDHPPEPAETGEAEDSSERRRPGAESENTSGHPRLHLSKGVHLVLDRDRLPLERMVIMTTSDRRNIFAIPRGRTVYVGTTDTTYHGDQPLWPEITPDDADYLLDTLNATFDVEPLNRSDVVAAWAGVRPLIAEEGKEAKDVSRKDEIWSGPSGILTIAGGKLTGFRKMADDVCDAVEELLARRPADARGATPLPGGDFDGDLTALAYALVTSGGPDVAALGAPILDRLVRAYGSETSAVLALGAEPLVAGGETLVGEVRWAVEVEAATTAVDVIYRRLRAAWYTPADREALVPVVVGLMGDLLGWDGHRREVEATAVLDRYRQELELLGS